MACAWTGSRPPTFLPAVISHEIVGVVGELGPEPPLSFEAEPLVAGDLLRGCAGAHGRTGGIRLSGPGDRNLKISRSRVR